MPHLNTVKIDVSFNDAVNDSQYGEPTMRQADEIHDALQALALINWHSIHEGMRLKIEEGEIQIVDDKALPPDILVNGVIVRRDCWEDALQTLALVEQQFGEEYFGSRSDFEWGMVIGKLFALRWVIGDEWPDNSELVNFSNDSLSYDAPYGDSVFFNLFPEVVTQVRDKDDIREAQLIFDDLVWYNNHMVDREEVERGNIKIVKNEKLRKKHSKYKNAISRDIWDESLHIAKLIEDMQGIENIGPWTKLEFGIINGKLSALGWVLGEDWDPLNT